MIDIPLKPMTDSESLYAIRLGLSYMTIMIFGIFVYFAMLLPLCDWLLRWVKREQKKLKAK